MLKILTTLLIISSLTSETIAQTDDYADIESVIVQLFDGMRESDRAKAAGVFHETMQLSTVMVREGEAQLVYSDHNQFLDAIAQPKEEAWDEQYSDLEIHIDGNLATAWMNYTFHRGDQFSHCGVNTMNFIRTTVGWKIFSLTDTRRTEGC
jgi:hypothetical protein